MTIAEYSRIRKHQTLIAIIDGLRRAEGEYFDNLKIEDMELKEKEKIQEKIKFLEAHLRAVPNGNIELTLLTLFWLLDEWQAEQDKAEAILFTTWLNESQWTYCQPEKKYWGVVSEEFKTVEQLFNDYKTGL